MNIEEMKKKKIELGYSNEQIAALSGVPLGTVQKIFAGITKHPRYDTLQALEDSFQGGAPSDPQSVCESGVAYQTKKQGEYTLDDYYAMPEDRRVELIDGVIYDMTAPLVVHQYLIGEIFTRLKNYVRQNKGKCMPMMAPTDVRLDMDEKTMVQPDVLVLCNREQIDPRRLEGAPDFVVEVLSPSTKRKDSLIKFHKYADAGVREYWMVDPDKKRIAAYCFEEDDFCPAVYTFADKVPVAIWGGDCEIDFAEIYEEIRFLYEE